MKKPQLVQLWVLVGLLGCGGASLFAYGIMQPEPRRNLADPIPMAHLGVQPKPKFDTKPSVRRELAERENEAKRTECQWRHDDCSIACAQYPASSTGHAECMGFCNRARETCNAWTHR